MSDELSAGEGHINITVKDEGIFWESNFSVPEILFTFKLVEQLIVQKVLNNESLDVKTE